MSHVSLETITWMKLSYLADVMPKVIGIKVLIRSG